MAPRPLITRSRTQLRLVLGVVTVSVLPLLLLASVSISRQRGVAIDRAFETLEGVAAAQVAHLDGIATADRELSELLASNAQLQNALIAHYNGDDVDSAKLNDILAAAMSSSDRLVNICLHATEGVNLASMDPDAGERYNAFGLRPGSESYVSRVVDGPAGEPTSVTNAEIVVNGVRLGTVTIETDTTAIHELVTDYEGLSETGETSVAQATPAGAQFIAPLRFKDDAVLAIIVPQTATAAPITLAMAGEVGRFGDTIDYRQTQVLAVTRHVETTGWGVVVKIDREEALAGVEHFQGTVAITLAGAILLVLMISLGVGKMVWRPVREVTAAAVAVAGGDRSRRADVYRFDELGDLAGAVNTMTDELLQAAAADASRRVELEQVNSLLLSSEERLTYQAQHDELTGLANRFHFRDMLAKALVSGAESGQRVAVLFIDLDRFKMVNDSRGHLAGDELLLQVAHRIENTVHADDTVARFGGDEFVVLCPDAQGLDRVEALAESVHASLEGTFVVDGEQEHVACSIGMAISSADSSPDSLVSDADVAMYRAKNAGRNRSVLFDVKMRRWVKDRHELESALRNALVAGELEVHYQPIVDLNSGEFIGLEALSRWDRKGHGRVSPDEFIAVAEESGLIVQLGRWVFRHVCEQRVEWAAIHPELDLRVTVNLSARELAQADCVEAIAGIIAETGAHPKCITLELTETALSYDLDATVRNLNHLHEMGFSIAIDDFGTGYSSLTYLRRFPIDTVKIDRSFMTELEGESIESSIVALVIGLGHSLGIDVIAEGVETEVQLAALRGLNCQLAQGYLFAQPQSAERIEHLLWPQFDPDELANYNMSSGTG